MRHTILTMLASLLSITAMATEFYSGDSYLASTEMIAGGFHDTKRIDKHYVITVDSDKVSVNIFNNVKSVTTMDFRVLSTVDETRWAYHHAMDPMGNSCVIAVNREDRSVTILNCMYKLTFLF